MEGWLLKWNPCFILFFAVGLNALSSQLFRGSPTTSSPILPESIHGSTNVNFLVFYDSEAVVPAGWGAALYVNYTADTVNDTSKDPAIRVGHLYPIYLNASLNNSQALTKLACEIVSAALSGENPASFALDMTSSGLTSDVAKAIVRSLQIPTIAGSYGYESNLKKWKDLKQLETGYLIQINPPSEIIAESMRTFAATTNMSDVAVFYDPEYFDLDGTNVFEKLVPATSEPEPQGIWNKMVPKYKDLPNVMINLAKSAGRVQEQLQELKEKNISNIFVAASSKGISHFLGEASSVLGADFEKQLWYTLSLDTSLPSCEECQFNASIIHISPVHEFSQGLDRREWIANVYSKSNYFVDTLRNDLLNIFEFDLTATAILAVGYAQLSGENFTATAATCGSPSTAPEDLRHLNLYPYLEKISKDNMLPTVFRKQNGRNWPNFETAIEWYMYPAKSRHPEITEYVGSWTPNELAKEGGSIQFVAVDQPAQEQKLHQ